MLFSAGLWEPALEKYAAAAHVTVKVFDADLRAVLGPIHPTPLFQLFETVGYDPALFVECARRCLVQTDRRPTVIVSRTQGLAALGASLALDGKVVGAAVAGYVLLDFSQASEILRIAREANIEFDRLWEITRAQKPVPQSRLILDGELLQVLGDALLKENSRTRLSEANNERLEGVVEERTGALRELSSKLLTAQDDERRRISRELHDSVGQNLVAIKMGLESLSKADLPEEQQLLVKDLKIMLDAALAETRTLSYLLHPPLLDEVGFTAAADWYVRGFAKRSDIRVNLNIPRELGRLPEALEIVLFRILQEGLTNVHRHARSESVDVVLRICAGEIIMDVRDHGRGMPPELVRQLEIGIKGAGVGVGLRSMRERTHELDGRFEILPDADGTLVRVAFPLTRPPAKKELSARRASNA
jgi:signal transduction histidine kinase